MARVWSLLGRFVGFVITMLGLWMIGLNIVDGQVEPLILTMGVVGALGGVLYLLSFEGPRQLRSKWVRMVGWAGMLALGVLPWSFWMHTFALVILAMPSLFLETPTERPLHLANGVDRKKPPATSPKPNPKPTTRSPWSTKTATPPTSTP